MIINRSFKDFKFRHRSKKNQIIFTKKKVKNDEEVLNLIDNFLEEKNSFIFESVEKGKIKGRYTIFGKNPDKIWEFNNNNSYLIQRNKKRKLNDKPDKLIEKIIEDFKFETPKNLPNICSLISGYFSYDSIRYIEKIPNNCKNDLNLPDVRLLRPRTLVIHDNLKKEIFYISNIFKDEKIKNYKNKYEEVKSDLFKLLIQSSIKNIDKKIIQKSKNIKVKSNTSKNKFLSMVNKAKKYIKLGDIFQVVLSQRFEAKLTKESFIIERYSHVMHIVSNVVGEYNKKFSKFKSLLAGFPAGTVSGAPKIRAMEIIDELETTKRKVYAGGIGYFSANGEFDTCIALRTAVAKNKKFYVQAGAGIVADSKPKNEYEETVNKAKALINALR